MADVAEDLKKLMEAGTEEEVRSYVAQHFNELPEEMRKDIGVALFEEALQEDISERDAVLAAKREAVAAIEALEAAEKESGEAQV